MYLDSVGPEEMDVKRPLPCNPQFTNVKHWKNFGKVSQKPDTDKSNKKYKQLRICVQDKNNNNSNQN